MFRAGVLEFAPGVKLASLHHRRRHAYHRYVQYAGSIVFIFVSYDRAPGLLARWIETNALELTRRCHRIDVTDLDILLVACVVEIFARVQYSTVLVRVRESSSCTTHHTDRPAASIRTIRKTTPSQRHAVLPTGDAHGRVVCALGWVVYDACRRRLRLSPSRNYAPWTILAPSCTYRHCPLNGTML